MTKTLRSSGVWGVGLLLWGCASSSHSVVNESVVPTQMATATQAATTQPTVFDIPRITDQKDFERSAFQVNAFATVDGFAASPDAFSPRMKLGWNDEGLLAEFVVHEPSLHEMDKAVEAWKADAVELVVAPSLGSKESYQLIISPGVDGVHPDVRTTVNDSRRDRSTSPIHISPVRTKTDDGYTLNVTLPWSAFGIEPAIGGKVALQATVDSHEHETDGNDAQVRAAFFPSLNSFSNTKQAYELHLADHASPPIQMMASSGYDRFRRLHVDVFSGATLNGSIITARLADGKTATTQIAQHDSPAVTSISFPLPPPRTLTLTTQPIETVAEPSTLSIDVAGHVVTLPVMGDLNETRSFAYRRERLSAKNFIFDSVDLPTIDFERPAEVEDEIGFYRLHTTYYNADLKPVSSAARPGRYGAVVEIFTGSHLVDRRYLTLFRADKKFNWIGAFDGASAQLPKEMGLEQSVLAEQQDAMSVMLRGSLNGMTSRDQSLAVLFTGLAESRAGETGARYENFARRNDAWWIALKKSIGQFVPYRTVVQLPPGYERGSGTRWPLILFLHGSDAHSDRLDFLKTQGLCAYRVDHPELPFVIISPATPAGERYSPATLLTLLDESMQQYDVDPDHVYLTGLSLGGMGSWDLAAEAPDRFAAVAPIAGFGDPLDAERLRTVPLWSFHGDADPTVPIEADRACVEALQAIHGRVKSTVYPGVGHNSWTQTYANPELYKWFLDQRRGAPAQPRYSTTLPTPASTPATTSASN